LEGFLRIFVQVKNFHLTLQIELLMEILKILVLNFSSMIPLIKKKKKHPDTKTIKF
jgi:hypothetical protein